MDDRERMISDRAYAIWEREGRPEGREREHWEQARREVDAERGSVANATAEPTAADAGEGSTAGKPGARKATTAAGAKKPTAAGPKKPKAGAKEKPIAAGNEKSVKDKPAGTARKKKTDT